MGRDETGQGQWVGNDMAVGTDVISSDRKIRLPLFRDQISKCTNLFWLEPNRTRHRIFAVVSLLFGNL